MFGFKEQSEAASFIYDDDVAEIAAILNEDEKVT